MNHNKRIRYLGISFLRIDKIHFSRSAKSRILFLCILLLVLTSCQFVNSNTPDLQTEIPGQFVATKVTQPQQTDESRTECIPIGNKYGEGSLPPVSTGHSLAYDSLRQRTILFGGFVDCQNDVRSLPSNQTWEYDGENWYLVETNSSPPPSTGAQLIYDPAQRYTFLIGDYPHVGEVWQYDGVEWTDLPVTGTYNPISSGWLTAAYIPQKEAIYVLGACFASCSDEGHYSGWLFDGQSWMEEPIIPFGARPDEPTFMTPEIAYHEKEEILVLQTGFGGQPIGSWALNYNGIAWEVTTDSTSTSGLNDLSLFFDMVYDSNREVVVLFGAFDKDGQVNEETWEYDGVEWSQAFPLESPSIRTGHAMAYDQQRGIVVLYGGTDPTDENQAGFYETWEYDGKTWIQK